MNNSLADTLFSSLIEYPQIYIGDKKGNKMKLLYIIIIFLSCLNSVYAQNKPSLEIERVMLESDIERGSKLSLSPSGSLIAYINRTDLCILLIEFNETSCKNIPWSDGYLENISSLNALYLEWSPDENYLTFAKYPFFNPIYDSDIWLFDIESQEFSNLTEDRIEGIVNQYQNQSVLIDFHPLWDPSSEVIYFFRARVDNLMILEVEGLFKISLPEKTTNFLHPLSGNYYFNTFKASLSPAGDKLAMIRPAPFPEGEIQALNILSLRDFSNSWFYPEQFREGWDENIEYIGFTQYTYLEWTGNNILINMFGSTSSTVNGDVSYLFYEILVDNQQIRALNFTKKCDKQGVMTSLIPIGFPAIYLFSDRNKIYLFNNDMEKCTGLAKFEKRFDFIPYIIKVKNEYFLLGNDLLFRIIIKYI